MEQKYIYGSVINILIFHLFYILSTLFLASTVPPFLPASYHFSLSVSLYFSVSLSFFSLHHFETIQSWREGDGTYRHSNTVLMMATSVT